MRHLRPLLLISLLAPVAASAKTRMLAEKVPASNNTIFIDTDTARVGVGTSSPGTTLDVNGNALVRQNLTASSGSFTGGGGIGVVYGVSAATAAISGGLSADSIGVANSVTASSGTFTQTGASNFSLQTSSGVSVATGKVLIGAGGYVQWPDGTTSTTAASGGGGGAGTVTGSGTANKIPKWTSSSALGDSVASEVNGGLSISSAIFTAVGSSTYAVTSSSGLHVQNGEVKLDTGAFVRFADGTTQATAPPNINGLVLASPTAGNFLIRVADGGAFTTTPTTLPANPGPNLVSPNGTKYLMGVADNGAITSTLN